MKTKLVLIVVFATNLFSCNPSKKESAANSKKNLHETDPLPSWNEGESKQAILDFVVKTTKKESSDFVAIPDRIACFDNDGTLWSEQPMYFQLAFALDEFNRISANHPEWKINEAFKPLFAGDVKTFMAGGTKSIMTLMKVTHSGMDVETYNQSVKNWMSTAVHPKSGKHYNQMIYQPMLELLNYLRANGYKTFIVSGGGVDFMRPWVEKAYGITPDQVVGSSGKVKYDTINGKPVLTKLPELNFINDKEGKPIGIHQHIGKRPVFTAGNSDGDYAMLQYASSQSSPHFSLIVHHTDSIREWAYDRNFYIGRLEKGLDDAQKYGWLIVDMNNDWNRIYPFDK